MTHHSQVGTVSLESTVLYPMYFRQYGVRRAVQLVAPTLNPIQKLKLPLGSVLHFVSDDESLYGIPTDDYILNDVERLMLVDHVLELGDSLGPPRPTRIPPGSMIREYHRKYRKTRWLTKLDVALKDVRTLVIENYALLPHLFRYTTSYFRGYYKWWNIQGALWKRVGELSAATERQQYIEIRLPKQLPSLAQLRRGEARVSRVMLSDFNEPESLSILEMWKWLGPNRSASVISKATPAQLERMNIVWLESDRWILTNLGLLDSWRKPTVEEIAAGVKEHGIIDPLQLQKRFLRMLMFLMEVRTVSAPAAAEPTDSKVVGDNSTDTSEIAKAAGKVGPLSIKLPDAPDVSQRKLKLAVNLNIDALPDHPVEESHENILLIDESITKDLEALDHLATTHVSESDEEPPTNDPTVALDPFPSFKYTPTTRSLEEGVMSRVDALADGGLLSGAEYRRFNNLSSAYSKLKDPYGSGATLEQRMEVKSETLALSRTPNIAPNISVFDKSMLKSSLSEFDSRYIEEVLPSDILRTVVAVQHAGVAVTDYTVELVEDALNSFEAHTVSLTPVVGKPSTLNFKIPKVNADGTYKANGVRYRLRKQRGDLPIRKLSSDKVGLTSYYSRTIVSRSEKAVNNYAGWLTNKIAALGMSGESELVQRPMLSDVFNSNNVTPRLYSILASRFRSFLSRDIEFFFDYDARKAYFGKELVEAAEMGDMLVIGRKQSQLVLIDNNDVLYLAQPEGEIEVLGTIEQLLEFNSLAPLEVSEIKIFDKQIPVGIFLAYQLGIQQLLNVLNVNPRRVPSGERLNLSDDEYALKFQDETLVFRRDNRRASQVLAGIAVYEKAISNYPLALFNKKDIYFNILERSNIGVRYLREMDLMMELFIDPITEEILREMGEPTDFIGLLLRAVELLLTDWSPDETDMAYMRVKGYERIAGAVYGELVRAIRLQRARGTAANARIDMPPYAVWQSIAQDPAVKLIEESNPVHNLKEVEEVTYSGVGGRSSRSMVRRTRVFHPNDMGIISEATKDSADVAITTFLTADPGFTNLRGLTKKPDLDTMGPTSLLSTSALLAPAADRDDPKRVNFISIQQSAGTFAKGYRPSPLRTGYEQILAHRTDDMFAYTAKQAGKITAVSAKVVEVTYNDESVVRVELGRRFGIASGMTFPHQIETSLQVGDAVEVGDIISYNTNYFEKDALNSKQVVWKAGVLVKTAILESVDTLEDSSVISEDAAQLLETEITEVRNIVVSFDQAIHNLVVEGMQVDPDSILCTIEDAVTAKNDLFDEASLDTLRLIARNTPRAKSKGKVEKIEVFYHGDIDDMSPSLQDLANQSDRNRRRLSRELKTTYTSGRVDQSLRVDGNDLGFENAVIKIYITGVVGNAVGDKAVFGNQMKTIFGRVMAGVNKTESGAPIDALFSYQSINDRLVRSPELMGTTNTLLKLISKRVVNAYRGNT